MICSKKSRPAAATAGTVISSGKMVRACDSCVCRRARWYCAADDAFLCQNCDSSVHSANTLARRHHRVRLQTSSVSKPHKLAPAWHHGFKRKARTPRPSKAKTGCGVAPPFVPEIETSAEDGSNEEEDLLYRVPIFNPVLAEFCTPPLADETSSPEAKPTVQLPDDAKVTNSDAISNNNEFLAGFPQSDAELAEFAANMESLLGRGFDDDSFSMEELGLIGTKYSSEDCGEVKEEVDNDMSVADDNSINVKLYEEIDLSRETPEINFDCRSRDEEQQETTTMEATEEYREVKRIGLRLDYEAIAVEWSAHGLLTPWVNGERPQFGPDDCWLDYMVCAITTT